MSIYYQPLFTQGTTQYQDFDMSMKPNPFTGDLRLVTDLADIKQSLTNLLYTNFGERPFNPTIGAGLGNLLFEPLDKITQFELSNAIQNVINNWEPRITILDLDITEDTDVNGIQITLVFKMVNISQAQTVSITLQRVR